MFAALKQDEFQEDDDTAAIADGALFETSVAFESSFAEIDELNKISSTLDDLQHLSNVIRTHGVTTSLLAFTNRDQLLSSAIPAFSACEALGVDAAIESLETSAAIEGIASTIKDLAASWFKKAWDAIVSFGGKIGDFAKAVGNKVVATSKVIAGKVFNAAKAAKEKIKAHPIASAVAAVALVVSITSVIGLIWGLPLPTSALSSSTWAGTVRNKILNAVGSGGFKVNGLDITYPAGAAVEIKTAGALGYTGESCNALVKSAGETLKSGGPFSRLGEFITTHAKKLFDTAKAVGGAGLEFARTALNHLIRITRVLWRFLTSRTVSIIMGALNIINGLFGSHPTSEGKELVPA